MNATFWEKGSDAPVFLCVGGEGPPLDGSVVVASPHCNVAVEWLKETKAIMFAVEHRYYGCHNASACPFVHGDAKPWQWLSSRQVRPNGFSLSLAPPPPPSLHAAPPHHPMLFLSTMMSTFLWFRLLA